MVFEVFKIHYDRHKFGRNLIIVLPPFVWFPLTPESCSDGVAQNLCSALFLFEKMYK